MADESWLALDADPEKFGKAMLYCQDASGSCVRNAIRMDAPGLHHAARGCPNA